MSPKPRQKSTRIHLDPPKVKPFPITATAFYDLTLLSMYTRGTFTGVAWTKVPTVVWMLRKTGIITAKVAAAIPKNHDVRRLFNRHTRMYGYDDKVHLTTPTDPKHMGDSEWLCSAARLYITAAGCLYAEAHRDMYPVPWQEIHAWKEEYKRLHELRKTGQLNKEIDAFFKGGDSMVVQDDD